MNNQKTQKTVKQMIAQRFSLCGLYQTVYKTEIRFLVFFKETATPYFSCNIGEKFITIHGDVCSPSGFIADVIKAYFPNHTVVDCLRVGALDR